MRRLILEFNKDEMLDDGSKQLQNVKTLEVMQYLRQDNEEVAMVCRIELEEAVPDVEHYVNLIGDDTFEVKVLEREKDGSFIVFVKIRLSGSDLLGGIGGYVVSREVREGKIKVTILGSVDQLKGIIEEFRRIKRRFSIVSLTDAKFSVDSPLNSLTEKQREVLVEAFRSGYYDLPRKISSAQLAKRLNLHKSALASHRRKAELRLLTHLLNE